VSHYDDPNTRDSSLIVILVAVPDTPGGWGNQAGHMAFAQIPLIIGLAQKNNVISCERSLLCFRCGMFTHINFL
jgi:hypothetical protein